MQVGDILDIERLKPEYNLRRVLVKSHTKRRDGHYIVGTNMHGKCRTKFLLPLKEGEGTEIRWNKFDNSGECDP